MSLTGHPSIELKNTFDVLSSCKHLMFLALPQVPKSDPLVLRLKCRVHYFEGCSGKYPRSYSLGGAKVSEGVTEVRWSGGNLPDTFYDEFVFTSAIANELEPGKTIYFPVVQECEKGVHRWIEIPAGGHSHDEASEPAPGLRLLPKR